MSVQSVGTTYFLSQRAEVLGVTKLLASIFPDCYQSMLQIAFYMLNRGNVLLYMDDYFEMVESPSHDTVSQRHLNRIYEQITYEKRWEFFKQWKSLIVKEDEYVAYDVTSISTHAKDVSFAERGYNRDHELLPQINVGLFFAHSATLSVGYDIYNGSITDQTYLPTMLVVAKELGIKPLLFVMDKGFLNANNLNEMVEEVPFLMSVPPGQTIYKDKFLQAEPTIRDYDHYIEDNGVYGIKDGITIDGNDYSLHVYLDYEKVTIDERVIYQRIREKEQSLEKALKRQRRVPKSEFFEIEMEKEKVISYKKDKEGIQKALKCAGMFGLISNKTDITPENALKIYRRRNAIEAHYNSMKNFLEFDRLHTHKDQSTQGKFFIEFIAQILQADMIRVMNRLDKKPIQTIRGMLLELEKITRVKQGNTVRLMKPLTKKQKDILSIFDIEPKEFEVRIKKSSPSV
ncbi:transposase [Tuanshanicoccus lijuaniae]|uniref:IS1634 family transposase n=1 Tax=Aerococcaceae bacterium zg-1292 TaxID=2774330 RepID=UPI00193513BB|nr:transposase [Aerococcaceae bacterium zg-1292]QQA36594.1 transposase [Aerococcaceae bacterium zg-1292]